MNLEEVRYLASSVRFRLSLFWYFLFMAAICLLIMPFIIPIKTPVTGSLWKNVMFIIFVLHLAGIYYLKRLWLSATLLKKIAEGTLDTSKSFGLPLVPLKGEMDAAGGVFYHIRRSLFLLYFITLSAMIWSVVYYFVFAVRQDMYTFAIVLMIALLINYPRVGFFNFLIEYSEEETHDSQ